MFQDVKLSSFGGTFIVKAASDACTPEDLTNEQELIAQTASQFAEKDVYPYKQKIDEQNFELVVRLMKKAGEIGLLAHSVPEAYGGLGLDKVTKGIVGEALGKTGSYGVAHANHTCIATLPITYFGTKAQKKRYLPKLASGEYIGAYCLTEPEAGSDALSARTTAVLNNEKTHYILNGTKQYITSAAFADTFITYAKVDGKHFTAFIVEKNFQGLSIGPEEKKMGIKGSSTCPVIYEDCLVPVDNVLGEVGKGHVIALNVLNLGRYNLGFACVGGAKHALELTLSYTKERKQFQTAIAHFPATKEKLALMNARIYAAESLQYRTGGLLESVLAGAYENNDPKEAAKSLAQFAMECSVCKVYSSEAFDTVVDEALQLHGGAGFIQDYEIESVYRDSRINRIFEGTNEINRLVLPTHFLRKVKSGELVLNQETVEQAYSAIKEGNHLLPLEKKAVHTVRYLLLLLLSEALKVAKEHIVHEQEALMKLSNLAIGLYAMESAVIRTEKAVRKNGKENEQLKVDLTELVVDLTMREVRDEAMQLINGIATAKKHQALHYELQTLMRDFQYEGTFTKTRRVADELIESGRYTC